MVLLSFSVLKDQLLSGAKTRTMRAVLKDGHINQKWQRVYEQFHKAKALAESPTGRAKGWSVKFRLQLWWKSRSPKRERLFDAWLINITKRKLGDLTEDEWQLDGFKPDPKTHTTASYEGKRWFMKTYRPVDVNAFEVYIIEFRRV